MQKWEYRNLRVVGGVELDRILKAEGEREWELVTVLPEPDQGKSGNTSEPIWRIFFKRPLR